MLKLQKTESVRYRSASGLPVETVSLASIRAQGSSQHLAAVQRPDFAMFLLYTEGHGEHTVDFERLKVEPGVLIFVQAGGTHQFHLNTGMNGRALVIDQAFLLPSRLSSWRPALSELDSMTYLRLNADAQADFLDVCAKVTADTERFGDHPLIQALLRERVLSWLMLLHIHWSGRPAPANVVSAAQYDVTRLFRQQINLHYLERWTVADYAKKLGYSERTLTRFCQRVEGHSAKSVIDARLLLEARRWLANSDETLDSIAFRLKFGDASNLVQFFRRTSKETPSAFRARYSLVPKPKPGPARAGRGSAMKRPRLRAKP